MILNDGRVIGTWKAEGHRVTPELFAPVAASVAAALDQEVQALSAWLRHARRTSSVARKTVPPNPV